MGLILRDELTTTPPKLSLSSLPSHHKPPPEPLGALTPPLHPMVSVPFQWEEAPGRPKTTTPSSPFKPKSMRCLDLPPKMLVEAKVSISPNTILDGPHVGRSLSQRFCFVDPGSRNVMGTPNLGLVGNVDGLVEVKRRNDLRAHFGSCRWANGKDTEWDMDIKVKITRFRRSKKSLYEFSYKSSRLLEGIYGSLKQMMMRRHTNKRS